MKKSSKNSLSPGPSERTELGLLIERITELVEKDPRKAAIILTDWANRSATSPTVKKEQKKKAG
jgi:hypothetical protein